MTKKEMAQPRAAASTQSEVLGASTLAVARVQKTKKQQNRSFGIIRMKRFRTVPLLSLGVWMRMNHEYVRNGTDIRFQCVQHWGWVARALLCKSLASVPAASALHLILVRSS